MAMLASLGPLCRVGHACKSPTNLLVSHLFVPRSFKFYSIRCNLDRPNVVQLAAKAQISLTAKEVEDFGPKIEQVIDWFGQLKGVNLENVEPAIRADTDGLNNLRPDIPCIFKEREVMMAAVPTLEEPYIKVPKILKENTE